MAATVGLGVGVGEAVGSGVGVKVAVGCGVGDGVALGTSGVAVAVGESVGVCVAAASTVNGTDDDGTLFGAAHPAAAMIIALMTIRRRGHDRTGKRHMLNIPFHIVMITESSVVRLAGRSNCNRCCSSTGSRGHTKRSYHATAATSFPIQPSSWHKQDRSRLRIGRRYCRRNSQVAHQ